MLLRSRRKAASDDADWIEDGRAFHARVVGTVNARSPSVKHRVELTCHFVMT